MGAQNTTVILDINLNYELSYILNPMFYLVDHPVL